METTLNKTTTRLEWRVMYRIGRIAAKSRKEAGASLPEGVWDAVFHVRTVNDGRRVVMGDCLQSYGAMGPRFRLGRLNGAQRALWRCCKANPRIPRVRQLP